MTVPPTDVQCPFCAGWTPADSARCAACGTSMEKRCPYCAEKIHLLATACRHCRSELREEDLRRDAGR